MSQTPFYVIGHKNPDTDAICSAIGYAALLRATGEVPNAEAARCGDVSQRTKWALERAGIDFPTLVTDVRTKAGMICHRKVIKVSTRDTFLTAYQSMIDHDIRCVPVEDTEGQLCGILRYSHLLKLLLPPDTKGLSVRTVHTSLHHISDTLKATIVGPNNDTPSYEEEDQILLVAASSEEAVLARLESAKKEGRIHKYFVICGQRPSVQKFAIDYGCRALLVTGGHKVSTELQAEARKRGTYIIMCEQDTASASTLIRCSRTVRHVMETHYDTVSPNEPVSRLRKLLSTSEQDLFPVVEGKNHMIGVISKSDLVDPPRIKVALVDHNEYAQAVNGVEEAEVTEVIDHHRLAGDLVSREPIRFLNEPVGSTSTLVARKFIHRDLEPEPNVALCLCAGIVSDTLCLTSPTTTNLDREILSWLGAIAGIVPKEFSEEFFAVGSLIANGTPDEILNADRKEFNEQGFNVSIAQVEERDLHGFEARREELEAAMRIMHDTYKYDLSVLAVTDVALHRSMILAIGSKAMLDGLPFERIDDNLYLAPGVVSRKRQIFPAVCEALSQAH